MSKAIQKSQTVKNYALTICVVVIHNREFYANIVYHLHSYMSKIVIIICNHYVRHLCRCFSLRDVGTYHFTLCTVDIVLVECFLLLMSGAYLGVVTVPLSLASAVLAKR